MGLAFSNLGVIPASAPNVYGTVNKFLLPLAVPMLLLAADMRKVITHTGQLLAAFVVGAVGTTLGTLVAFKFIPLTSLGPDGWKVGHLPAEVPSDPLPLLCPQSPWSHAAWKPWKVTSSCPWLSLNGSSGITLGTPAGLEPHLPSCFWDQTADGCQARPSRSHPSQHSSVVQENADEEPTSTSLKVLEALRAHKLTPLTQGQLLEYGSSQVTWIQCMSVTPSLMSMLVAAVLSASATCHGQPKIQSTPEAVITIADGCQSLRAQ